MPFRFLRFPETDDDYVVVSESGEHLFLTGEELRRFVRRELDRDEPLHAKLEARHLLVEAGREPLDLLSSNRLKTRMFVCFVASGVSRRGGRPRGGGSWAIRARGC